QCRRSIISCQARRWRYPMPMQYDYTAIPEGAVPRAQNPLFQHLLDTYASETSKVASMWREFRPEDMAFKPAERSSSVVDIMKHQLLSERRFFAEFIGFGGGTGGRGGFSPELTPARWWRGLGEICEPPPGRLGRGHGT